MFWSKYYKVHAQTFPATGKTKKLNFDGLTICWKFSSLTPTPHKVQAEFFFFFTSRKRSTSTLHNQPSKFTKLNLHRQTKNHAQNITRCPKIKVLLSVINNKPRALYLPMHHKSSIHSCMEVQNLTSKKREREFAHLDGRGLVGGNEGVDGDDDLGDGVGGVGGVCLPGLGHQQRALHQPHRPLRLGRLQVPAPLLVRHQTRPPRNPRKSPPHHNNSSCTQPSTTN